MEVPVKLWHKDAACLFLTEIFYSKDLDGRSEVDRKKREDYCKAICFRCPVRIECLLDSLEGPEIWGVWGAMGEGERREFILHLKKRKIDEESIHDQIHDALESFYKKKRKQREKKKRKWKTKNSRNR